MIYRLLITSLLLKENFFIYIKNLGIFTLSRCNT
jgi:hypothetical protein